MRSLWHGLVPSRCGRVRICDTSTKDAVRRWPPRAMQLFREGSTRANRQHLDNRKISANNLWALYSVQQGRTTTMRDGAPPDLRSFSTATSCVSTPVHTCGPGVRGA